MEFNLILTTESKVVSTNIQVFQEQAKQYLASLTQTFETDDDFAQAKEEVKNLEVIEKKIRTAIDEVTSGNKEIAELIATAEEIAEQFRQERLSRSKLVKQREEEIKSQIINDGLAKIHDVRFKLDSTVSLAMERTMPKATFEQRLSEAIKGKRTFDSLKKAVESETNNILAEIALEATRLGERAKLIPAHYEHLFKDALSLIAGEEDLAQIVQQRIEAEQQREAEIRAKAEQQAREQAEREAKAKAEQQAQTNEETALQGGSSAEISTTETSNDEPLADFVITVRLNQIPQSRAVTIARQLKAQFGEGVSLNKAK